MPPKKPGLGETPIAWVRSLYIQVYSHFHRQISLSGFSQPFPTSDGVLGCSDSILAWPTVKSIAVTLLQQLMSFSPLPAKTFRYNYLVDTLKLDTPLHLDPLRKRVWTPVN